MRELIRHVKTSGVSLGQALRAAGRCGEYQDGNGQGAAISLTVSRSKISGLILEFSTSSPGRRQTIQLLLTGKDLFIEVPASERIAKQLRELAKCGQKHSASLKRRMTQKVPTASFQQ